jgi:hypothetical protein
VHPKNFVPNGTKLVAHHSSQNSSVQAQTSCFKQAFFDWRRFLFKMEQDLSLITALRIQACKRKPLASNRLF